MPRKTVVIGLLGTTLDAGHAPARWRRWRPSVAICQHPELAIDRFELLVAGDAARLTQQVVDDLGAVAPHVEVRSHPLALRDPWDFSEVYATLDAYADAYPWRTASEDYYAHITTGTHVIQICLFLLCETRAIPGVLLQSSPVPRDRVPRPPRGHSDVTGHGPPLPRDRSDATGHGPPLPRDRSDATGHAPQPPRGRIDVIDLELAKYDRLSARFRARRARGASLLKAGIETRNPAFNRMIDELEQVASRSRDPLLLTGETGTGKTALCARIYELKRARQHLAGELVAVNCATLRGDLAMSVLFGHARGAFTGAAEARSGLLRKAHGGLVFLDEIGELGRDEQAMLLTAIEERRFYPLGADKQVTSEFQLVAGTNRDLAVDVRAGRFRDDLLARIALWSFHIPALRERPEDLEPNLDYELERISAELGARISLARPARDAFLRFAATAPWRANFRDFNAAIRRMATLADGGRIDIAAVTAEIARLEASARAGTGTAGTGDDGLGAVLGARADELDRFDRVQLADVVAVCAASPSLSAAGRALFARSLAHRTTRNDADRLRKYLARFDLDFESLRR